MARNFTVTVKEFGHGTAWLLVEPAEEIGLEKGQHITMHLPAGVGVEQAQEIATFLNENVTRVAIERM